MKSPADWVDPTIDTANRRFFFFSSACRPFGMVNLSPDTVQNGTWGSGYRYDEPYILWFSHVHAWQLAGIPILPISGACTGPEGSDTYRSRFSHETEIVSPGYHAVTLDDYDIRAELTATERVGFHRYQFDRGGESHILFDLSAEIGPSEMSGFHIEHTAGAELSGYVENAPTVRRPKATRIFFVIKVDRQWDSCNAWTAAGVSRQVDHHDNEGGLFLSYTIPAGTIVQMKVAISYCSVAEAHNNLDTELPHWDFDRVRRESHRVWNQWLGRIEVRGGTDAQRVKFYTDLYHALLGRRRNSDVSGTWSDMTGNGQRIRTIPRNEDGELLYEHHNSDAFWGGQWNINLLWSIAYPEIVHNFCNTFVDFYKSGGLIPRGPSGGNYTFVMVSPSSTHLFASAYQKGIRTFDLEAAYEGLRKNHEPGGLISKAGYEHDTSIGGGAEHYLERGYVPLGIEAEAYHLQGAGQTLEYCFCDWALAQLADSLGHHEDAKRYFARSLNYRNLFNRELGFFVPRLKDGSWLDPFDPMAPDGWVEGNGWHYLWHVPHNVPDLIELMGGREAFIDRLDEAFRLAEPAGFTVPPGNVHHLNYVEYGNQPSLYLAHLFTYAGAPWLTQKWVRRIMKVAKSDITPYGGYSGDEDQGQMGALNVLMAIGLFNVTGGSDREPYYEITSPLFEEIVIHLDHRYCDGDTFTIRTNGSSEEAIYIQETTLNGKTLRRPWITHAELSAGGVLEVTLGTEPNLEWGTGPECTPPQSK